MRPPSTDAPDAPLHGYRGLDDAVPLERPRSLTVAISREAGARGSTLAAAVGRLLGWQVFPQEMLDFLARNDDARAELLRDVPDSAVLWAEHELGRLVRRRRLDPEGDVAAVSRLVFALAARGEAVLVGRGAGFVLPAESTVHVRVVAPLSERVAYLGQWLRLSEAEAGGVAAERDRRRAAYLGQLSDAAVTDPTQYDLFVNTGRVGTDAAAELVAQAVRGKQITDAKPDAPTALALGQP